MTWAQLMHLICDTADRGEKLEVSHAEAEQIREEVNDERQQWIAHVLRSLDYG